MSISKINAIIEIIIKNIFLIILFSLETELLSIDTNSFDVLSFVVDFFEIFFLIFFVCFIGSSTGSILISDLFSLISFSLLVSASNFIFSFFLKNHV